MRFLLYSHDGLGLGHTRRNLAIANLLAQLAPEASILVVTGVNEVTHFGLAEGIETLKLPSLRKAANGFYVARNMPISSSELRGLRSELLFSTVKSYRPTVVLVDKHPFGASGEFRQALEYVHNYGGRLVLGLRDILDSREAVLKEWGEHGLLKRIGDYYDLVLVYGQATIYDPRHEYDFPAEVAQRTRFCGYVVNQDEHKNLPGLPCLAGLVQHAKRPMVLASAGGGEDGFFLLETFIRAATNAPWEGIVITGPMTSESELKTLRGLAGRSKVTLHSFIPGLSALFWSADALVCMGGYNTLAEALSKGLPVVCVPRVTPRTEQIMRAEAFESFGLLQKILPNELNVSVLRQKIEAALEKSRQGLLDCTSSVLRFDGAGQAASHLLALALVSKAAPRPVERVSL